jgi:hypothetical protein
MNVLLFLSAEIAKLREMIFGTRVERFVPAEGATPEQLKLALQISDETASHCKISSSTKIEYVRTKVEVAPAKPKAKFLLICM